MKVLPALTDSVI